MSEITASKNNMLVSISDELMAYVKERAQEELVKYLQVEKLSSISVKNNKNDSDHDD